MNYKIKLYFVCSGTTCNDVIQSLSSIRNKELMEYIQTYQNTKQRIQKFTHLDELGIREMYLCSTNEFLKEKWKLSNLYSKVFCSLESSAIESAMALMDNQFDVCPIPFLSTQTHIQNEETYDYLTSLFPRDKKLSSQYWASYRLSFPMISNPAVDFRYSKKSVEWKTPVFQNANMSSIVKEESTAYGSYSYYSSISSLDSSKFQAFMNSLIPQMIAEGQVQNKELKSVLFVCTPEWIQFYLKSLGKKSSEYRFENSSVWEFKMDVQCSTHASSILSKNKTYSISSSTMKLKEVQKIYPTPFNYSPLRLSGKERYYIPMYKTENGYTMFRLRANGEKLSNEDLKRLKMSVCIEPRNHQHIQKRIEEIEHTQERQINKQPNKQINKKKSPSNRSNKKNRKNETKKKDIFQELLQGYSIG